MRLVGSKTEQDFRERLIQSHKLLFEDKSYKGLLKVLKSNFPKMKTAYFIGHIPEQGEDIYTMLIDVDTIVSIEISKCSQDERPIVETKSIDIFVKGISKIEQIKLAVALDLARKDIMQ